MSKTMTNDQYEKEMLELHEHIKSADLGRMSNWLTSTHTFHLFTCSDSYWEVFRELPRLIAAAIEYGRPSGGGKWAYSLVDPYVYEERVFGTVYEDYVQQIREVLDGNPESRLRGGEEARIEFYEEHILAWSRLKEFQSGVKEAGITRFKSDLTEHGLSAKEIKAFEKWIKEKSAEAEAFRNPAAKAPLFEAPKKGKYPVFDDTEYNRYISDLQNRYRDALDLLISYGLPFSSDRFEKLATTLEDFDYEEICATFGAQKRWPPEDDYGSYANLYETYANLPQLITKRFAETTAGEVDSMLEERLKILNDSSKKATHAWAFAHIREMKQELAWLAWKFPMMECPELVAAREKVAHAYDPRWALMAGGPLHEKRMKQIVFTTSPSMPVSEDDIPESINPIQEPVYAHVFMDQSLENHASLSMYFVIMKNERVQAAGKLLNRNSAYQVLQLFPDPKVGRDPELIRTFGKALESAADEGELLVKFSPDMTEQASGTLKLKMSAADIKKISARTEELVAAAEANRTAEAVLPDIFAEPQKWPYKDQLLTKEKVKEAIERYWEYGMKQSIAIKAMRVRYYRPGHEWDVEFDPLKRPVARLVFSYIGIVFEHDGRTFCVDDGIQLRQFWRGPGEGFGEDLNVLVWGGKPFELPPAQIKRVVE